MRLRNVHEMLEDGSRGYYRHLVVIEGEYKPFLFEIINEYLKVNKKPLVGYYFHPWIVGSKERLSIIKSKFNYVKDIDYSSSEMYLGETFDVALIDAVDDFRPSYIARAVETVRGGGIAVIFSDDIEHEKLYKSTIVRDGKSFNFFEERFRRKLEDHRGIVYYHNGDVTLRPFSSSETSRPKRTKDGRFPILSRLCATDDQVKVLDEVDFLLEEGKKLLAVTAARGRGKSASVGLSLSLLLSLSKYPVVIAVTSPTYWSGKEIMSFAEAGLRQLKKKFRAVRSKDGKLMALEAGESRIRWLPPELARDSHGDIIVIDEAAALGKEYLDYVLRRWNKVVIVSTIQGYEGSGKIFLKFLEQFQGKHDLQRLRLDSPIRYAKGDPVERFLYDTMLLDVDNEGSIFLNRIEEIKVQDIFQSEESLRKIYGILVTAHYRNSPDDLMMLGDASFQRLFEAKDGAGVVQIVEEGGLEKSKVEAISRGEENQGHLIPQRLIKYLRASSIGHMKGWRVMRIAVTPHLQDRGVGTALLSHIEAVALKEGVDWLGSSFLSTPKVLNFWIRNGYTPVHLATKKNEGLGGYSVIVIRPLSERSKELVQELSTLLKDKLLRTSHQVYFNLDPIVIVKLLKATPKIPHSVRFNPILVERLRAYLEGIIPYNSVADAVHTLAEIYFKELSFDVDDLTLSCLVSRTLQGKSWYHAGLALGLKSSEVEDKLREAVSRILNGYSLT
ncbi:tRNA(Met) cytidine acetyltransferase [Metallosphaera tengchongensis]|uniref:tRNA(Met) cytidine acetyltransferase TmcA n=1 Tax=Metallosphaera tengchongensis TaxID=1532350 RepID=A0A6N0NWP9_9CREN|nr:GNAT family N-acetyltransferase [Metallosphaera tengchongensis]QKR00059.1 tRNA(Met) cytidine acetyltransferase [Metallosphaera tengchongensis]